MTEKDQARKICKTKLIIIFLKTTVIIICLLTKATFID